MTESRFGLATAFAHRLTHCGWLFDIPEQLMHALYPLVEFGFWNFPKAEDNLWRFPTDDLFALDLRGTSAPCDEAFIRAAVEKLESRLGYKDPFYYSLLIEEDFRKWEDGYRSAAPYDYVQWEKNGVLKVVKPIEEEDFQEWEAKFRAEAPYDYAQWERNAGLKKSNPIAAYELAREARALPSISAVVNSGLIERFCEKILTKGLATYLAGTHKTNRSYRWSITLAHFLTPPSETRKLLVTSGSVDDDDTIFFRDGLYMFVKPIWEVVDRQILQIWGDDDVVADMRHRFGVCGGYEAACRTCQRLVTRAQLIDELTAAGKDSVAGGLHVPEGLSMKDLEDLREKYLGPNSYLGEGDADQEDEDANDDDVNDYDVSSPSPSEALPALEWWKVNSMYGCFPSNSCFPPTSDPTIDNVLRLVEALTSLGVTPNKAADVAKQLFGGGGASTL